MTHAHATCTPPICEGSSLSPFQAEFVASIADRPGYEPVTGFGCSTIVTRNRRPGPFLYTWYEAGELHMQRVGRRNVTTPEVITRRDLTQSYAIH